MIRAGLSTLHKAFYDEGEMGGMRSCNRLLSTGEAFVNMISYGIRAGHHCVYTYSLLDDCLFFSETGAVLTKDHASKHAIHANGATHARYAGTFQVCEKPERVVIFDNDSGTYLPQRDCKHMLEHLLAINFPDLKVVVLDVLQPQPAWMKEWFGPNEIKGDPHAVYPGTWTWRQRAAAFDLLVLNFVGLF